MRAVRYHEHGDEDVLQIDDVDLDDPGHGEVRVDVHAAGVNPVDTYGRTGAYEPPELPMTPGADLAGVVSAVGEGVDRFEVGDRVFGTGLGNDRQGTYAEAALAPADQLAVLPDGISFTEGAAAALVGVTSWRAIVDYGALEPAEHCLIHGGSGGVGHVAVQLAAAMGGRVTATARPEYHDRVRDLGADTVLDYARDDLAEAVTDVGSPGVILDHRFDDYAQFDADVAATGARVAAIGNTTPEAHFDDVPAARAKDVGFFFIVMFNTPDYTEILERLAALLVRGDIVPDVARTYDLSEAAAAQRDVMADSFFGKLVIEP